MTDTPPLTGQIVSRYRILEKLGGGMGVVGRVFGQAQFAAKILIVKDSE